MWDCRTCLTKLNAKSYVNVRTHIIEQTDVLQAIAEVAYLKGSHDDLLPKRICKKCFKLLKSTIMFRRTIIDSFNKLKHELNSNSEIKKQEIEHNIDVEGPHIIKVEEILFPINSIKSEPEVISENSVMAKSPCVLENNYDLSNSLSDVSNSSADVDIVLSPQMDTVEKQKAAENRNLPFLLERIHKKRKRLKNTPNQQLDHVNTADIQKEQSKVLNEDKLELQNLQHQKCSEAPSLTKTAQALQACSLCGLMIKGKKKYKIHMKTHNSDIPPLEFVCSICPKRYPKKEYLLIHIRSHTGEKPYHCKICDKSFTQFATYYVHKRRLHDKVVQGTCSYCGKMFVDKPELDVHIKMWHTGERPYLCEFCSATFVCNRTLQRHRKEIHSEKKPCQKCGKMLGDYAMKKHLVRHQVLEEGLEIVRKKYTCEYCKTVMNFTSRRRHLEKQHGIRLHGRGDDCTKIPMKEKTGI